jgi:hypothetical protein
MRKTVADLYRFYQVGRASNERYLEALAAAPDHRQGVIALDRLCRLRRNRGRHHPRAPQKAQRILGREGRGGVREQPGQDLLQPGTGPKGDVGGDLAWVGDPVVAGEAGLGERRQVRVDPGGEMVEQTGPTPGGQPVGQACAEPASC